ncbi:MAG: hypothetical protein AAF555_05345 [Verrucomicrobiota bacterium]
MSLKYFHIVFIIASFVLSTAFGLYCFSSTAEASFEDSLHGMGTVSLIIGGSLGSYGIWFLWKKSSKIITNNS